MGRRWSGPPVTLFAEHRQTRVGDRPAEGHVATPATGKSLKVLARRDRFL
jgi:hypothetical protein